MKDEPSLGLDTNIFLQVIDGGSAEQRLALAAQLADLLARDDVARAWRYQIVPGVLKLAVDPAADVRRVLAAGLAAVRELDGDSCLPTCPD